MAEQGPGFRKLSFITLGIWNLSSHLSKDNREESILSPTRLLVELSSYLRQNKTKLSRGLWHTLISSTTLSPIISKNMTRSNLPTFPSVHDRRREKANTTPNTQSLPFPQPPLCRRISPHQPQPSICVQPPITDMQCSAIQGD